MSVDYGKLELTADLAPHVLAADCILAKRGMIDYTNCPLWLITGRRTIFAAVC
jgi:hypothetical protein